VKRRGRKGENDGRGSGWEVWWINEIFAHYMPIIISFSLNQLTLSSLPVDSLYYQNTKGGGGGGGEVYKKLSG
jgi:hypothetical protein